MPRTLALLFLVLAGPVHAQVAAAVADVRGQPKHLQAYTRYLSLRHIPAAERPGAYLVLCGHVHHLSTTPDIVRPALVPGTAGALLRLNLKDYGWSVSLWEKLARADPYFHLRVTTVAVEQWGGGTWPADGKYYAANAFTVRRKKTVTTLFAGREDPKALAELAKLTYSEVPILYGDWWFNQTAAQADRNPGYYDFLGIKDQKTYELLIGFDKKLAQKFGNDLRASVADSSVTLQPRAMIRQATLGGGYWRTFDFRRAVDGKNPLRILGADIEKAADAQETYGHLPNGFFATGLFNGQGVRQDTAPDFIASDGKSTSTDRRVHINVSCIRCHAGSGLQPIDDWTRNLLQPPLAAKGEDYDALVKLRREYLRNLEPFLDRDRRVFSDAVKEATGWSVKEYSGHYAEFWSAYEDQRVNLLGAARYLGCSPQDLHDAIGASVAAGQGDPVLSVFLVRGLRLRTISVRQWEEIYPAAHALLAGVKKP